jgi:hypothetical protein
MEDDLKISKVEYLSNRLLDHTQILNLDKAPKAKCSNTSMKTTTNRRQQQNIESWISRQPLIGLYWNFEPKLTKHILYIL